MSLSQIKKAYKLFSHEHASKGIVRANVQKYLAAMAYLGDNHILAKPVQRKTS